MQPLANERSRCLQFSRRRRDMTRSEAAQYITDHFFRCSPKTLAKLAVVGGGPPFRKAGRVPQYGEASTGAWAESKIGPLVHSTTELAVSLGKKLFAEKAGEVEDEIASQSGAARQDPREGQRKTAQVREQSGDLQGLREFNKETLRLVQVTRGRKPERFAKTTVPVPHLSQLGRFLTEVAAASGARVD
jgi:hypothetical protein